MNAATLVSPHSLKILKYELFDVFRSRWVIFYGLFFLVVTDVLFRFGGSGERVIASLMNVVLYVIPLVAVMLGAMFLYNAREFMELLLTQPLRRRTIFSGVYAGLTVPLCLVFALGTSLPFLYHGIGGADELMAFGILILSGVLLTLIFVALGFAIALVHEDRVRGMGLALAHWLFFAVIYNGIVLTVVYFFGQYQVEEAVVGLTMLNPIDLARILLLLEFELSALMGYTGAVFREFFGSGLGLGVSLAVLLAWLGVPLALSLRYFNRKDL